jgi:hypothetical protein
MLGAAYDSDRNAGWPAGRPIDLADRRLLAPNSRRDPTNDKCRMSDGRVSTPAGAQPIAGFVFGVVMLAEFCYAIRMISGAILKEKSYVALGLWSAARSLALANKTYNNQNRRRSSPAGKHTHTHMRVHSPRSDN